MCFLQYGIIEGNDEAKKISIGSKSKIKEEVLKKMMLKEGQPKKGTKGNMKKFLKENFIRRDNTNKVVFGNIRFESNNEKCGRSAGCEILFDFGFD